MSCRKAIACTLLFLLLAETAMAWPIVRRRRRGSSGAVTIGQVYDDAYLDQATSNATYDWDEIAKTDAIDYIPIVLDQPINGKLEVKLTSLHNSEKTHTISVPMKNGHAKVKHKSIEPGSMYRLCVSIDGKQRVAGPYFTATSGKSAEARGRRQIVVRYFEQYWRKENGYSYYNTNCEAGYQWAIQPYSQLPGLYHTGGNLPEFDEQGMVHGDKCRSSSHTWMALAYDAHTGNVWCIDSNFSSTIMVIQRRPTGYSVGHLTADHIYQEEDGVAMGEND
jgi:hypothetical protein